ncbi:helix-turn-helix domain-containing protein [Streptomyces hoynatensis]|uniref:Helix-turn-helix domain-containing protein n=1 Tax=Streptomyces hoynatensis TaxID=1141874 RepID=A0A3A9Z665_9ACTN|nr:helix-turn-helix domain-containing protein [Streptomyces hoynatensis]RKN43740.1 helix-turn-helix domain-containing protein [Streptomyces hoynatensis]
MPVDAEDLPAPATPGPPAGLVTVGCLDEPPGYAVRRPVGARSWLFTWTTAGRGLLRQGGTAAEAGAGELVVLGPGVPHHYAVAPGAGHWAFWWVHCQARAAWGGWLRPSLLGDRLYAVRRVPRELWPRVTGAFRRMHADARWAGEAAPPGPEPEPVPARVAVAQGAAARELALSGLEEVIVLATAAAAAPGAGAAGRVDPRVRRAAALLAADPGAAHTVESLAAHVALSPSRLAHLFAEQLGQSPMRALRDARLRHAAQLLEATGLPVERVAAASGFASPYHFSRVFRQRYGLPPRDWRARRAGAAGETGTGGAGEEAGSAGEAGGRE